MSKTLKARIPQKIDTTENWNNSTLVLLRGEIGYEETVDGQILQKIGDGINIWTDLSYIQSGSTVTINRWEDDD